jgi:molecular chaperone DnaK
MSQALSTAAPGRGDGGPSGGSASASDDTTDSDDDDVIDAEFTAH